MKSEENNDRADLRTCTKCFIPQPLENYHNDQRGRDGKAYQCRTCRAKKAARLALDKIGRKPCVMVKNVIRTPRTREEIASITGYHEDVVSDVLAALWDSNEVKIDRETRRFRAA